LNDNTERMQQAWTSRDRARALDAAQEQNPTPRFQLGQMVRARAFFDCFDVFHAEVSDLIVTDLRLITGSGHPADIKPYWQVKAESLTDLSYVSAGERFFAPQIEPELTEEGFRELLATAYAALLPHSGSKIQLRGKPWEAIHKAYEGKS
jgi:hypothetical protein